MNVSIVIVSWNVSELLRKCLRSIFAHTSDVEVIVVDNASSDGTHDMVRSFPNVSLIQNTENKGFAVANNQGIAIAHGSSILLLNPDTELTEDSISKILNFADTHPKAGIIGCTLLNPDRTTQPSVRRFPRMRDIAAMLLKLHKIAPRLLDRYYATDFDYTKEARVDQVMGAFFFIAARLLKQAGGLDEDYFTWFEEVDYCRTAERLGFDVWYAPITSIVHYGGQSFAQRTTIKKQWWFFKSAMHYLRKKHA